MTVVGASKLKTGAVIDSPQLPFELRIDNYYRNSDLLGPAQAAKQNVEPRGHRRRGRRPGSG